MGFFSKIFKGIKKVVKGIGKVVKKVVKSKPFKAIAAVALAFVAPQLIPTIMRGISTAGAWAANTIATGASAAWQGIQAAGTAIRTFGGNVFQSVTDTISNGVKFMQNKVGLGTPSTLMEGQIAQEKAIAGFFGRETGTTVAKQTLGSKIATFLPSGEQIKERLKEQALDFAETTMTSAEKGGADPTGQAAVQQFRYADEDIKIDTGAGYEQLASLGFGMQSPYLGYQQGQQLFGSPRIDAQGNVQ